MATDCNCYCTHVCDSCIDALRPDHDCTVVHTNEGSAFTVRLQFVDGEVVGRTTYREHHPSEQALLRFFSFEHLPERLADVSSRFYYLANQLVGSMEPSPELTVALRKLLEAKDCAVRASVQ